MLKSLNEQLIMEAQKQEAIRLENMELRKKLIQIQSASEQEEEFISNMLLKKIDVLKTEKQDLLLKLEAEEELITNQLQKKLQKLQKEKVQMEISLEQEQEAMVNRLQKQLDNLRQGRQRVNSCESLSVSRTNGGAAKSNNNWQNDIVASNSVVELLKAEVWLFN